MSHARFVVGVVDKGDDFAAGAICAGKQGHQAKASCAALCTFGAVIRTGGRLCSFDGDSWGPAIGPFLLAFESSTVKLLHIEIF